MYIENIRDKIYGTSFSLSSAILTPFCIESLIEGYDYAMVLNSSLVFSLTCVYCINLHKNLKEKLFQIDRERNF